MQNEMLNYEVIDLEDMATTAAPANNARSFGSTSRNMSLSSPSLPRSVNLKR